MEVNQKSWRILLMGWHRETGEPVTLHFKELSHEPTIVDIQVYIEEEGYRINSLWEYVTVEVRPFFNIEDFNSEFI